jgi:small nuclear ribonucleoprotein (snRNP)-like protein
VTDKAPFVITHHGEAGEWYDSPVLRSLVGMTVVITTREGNVYEGVVESVNADENGYFSLTNMNDKESWGSVTLNPAHITTIHYC